MAAIQTLNNLETLASFRGKINSNFSNLLVSAPTSATSTGSIGQMAIDSSYVYMCTATNTWVRAPLVFATWS